MFFRLSALLGCFIQLTSYCFGVETPIKPDLAQSVVLVASSSHSACATGFLLEDGSLITNAHVSQSICPYGKCRELVLFVTDKINTPAMTRLNFGEANLVRELEAFDLALIKLSADAGGKIPSGVFKIPESNTKPANTAQDFYTLGFPGCGTLSYSSGKIVQASNLSLYTNILGRHGSSGSPLFDAAMTLHGVVDESTTLMGGLLSLAFNKPFEIRATKASHLNLLTTQPSPEIFKTEARMLLDDYRENIRSTRHAERLVKGYGFINRVLGLRSEWLNSLGPTPELNSFLWLESYPSTLARRPNLPISELDILTFVYNMELKGANTNFLQPLDSKSFLAELNTSQAIQAELDEFIQFAQSQNFLGLELLLLKDLGIFALIAAGILGLCAGLVGFILGRQGHRPQGPAGPDSAPQRK